MAALSWKRSCIVLGLLGGLSPSYACGSDSEEGPNFGGDAGGAGGASGSLSDASTGGGSGGRAAGGSGGTVNTGGDGGAPPTGDGGPAGSGAAGGTGGAGAGGTGGAGAGGADAGAQSCVNSLDCASSPDGRTICDTAASVCVQCLLPTDCMGTADCVNRQCVPYTACGESADCAAAPDGKLICDTGPGRCVECLGDMDCMMGHVCASQTCRTACDSDNDCTPMGQLCNQAGGFCVECVREQDCGPSENCVAGSCVVDTTPLPDAEPLPECTDGMQNGNETDVDCGGDGCPPCGPGMTCAGEADCTTGVCAPPALCALCPPVCRSATCTDNVLNGAETDVDCGGPTCGNCANGEACLADNDCQSGACTAGVCEGAPCDPSMCPAGGCAQYMPCCNQAGQCSCLLPQPIGCF